MGEKHSKLKPRDLAELNDNTEFSEQELKEWYKGFRKDYPHGYLTVEEFQQVYSNFYPGGDASAFAENTFRVFDHNRDGKIDFREFIIGLSMSMRSSFEDKMKYIFKLYDLNDNNLISKDEMLVIVKAIYKMCGSTDDSAAERQVNCIYEKMDVDCDGQITMEEFVATAKSDATVRNVLTGDMGNY